MHGLGTGHVNSCPADIFVQGWEVTVAITEASAVVGAAAFAAELRKHAANDPKCKELGWFCIPLAVETYGTYRVKRHMQSAFSRLAFQEGRFAK